MLQMCLLYMFLQNFLRYLHLKLKLKAFVRDLLLMALTFQAINCLRTLMWPANAKHLDGWTTLSNTN